MSLEDVGFGDERIHAPLLLHKGRIYPMLHVGVGRGVRVVELLVSKVKLLYPSLAPLLNAVCRVLIGHEVIGKAIQLIAEGKAVVVEAEYDARFCPCRVGIHIGVLVGTVATLTALAGKHGIAGLKGALFGTLERQSRTTSLEGGHTDGRDFNDPHLTAGSVLVQHESGGGMAKYQRAVRRGQLSSLTG